jgi:hypothetical protein
MFRGHEGSSVFQTFGPYKDPPNEWCSCGELRRGSLIIQSFIVPGNYCKLSVPWRIASSQLSKRLRIWDILCSSAPAPALQLFGRLSFRSDVSLTLPCPGLGTVSRHSKHQRRRTRHGTSHQNRLIVHGEFRRTSARLSHVLAWVPRTWKA